MTLLIPSHREQVLLLGERAQHFQAFCCPAPHPPICVCVRVRMSSGERPMGKPPHTEALCQTPPRFLGLPRVTAVFRQGHSPMTIVKARADLPQRAWGHSPFPEQAQISHTSPQGVRWVCILGVVCQCRAFGVERRSRVAALPLTPSVAPLSQVPA